MYSYGARYDEEDGLFKLWYEVPPVHAVGYATSPDGVSWTKPDLRLVEVGGTRHSNVCRLNPRGSHWWN